VGPHALALLLPVLGPVARVYATLGPHQTAYVTLDHRGGAVSTLALSLDAPPAAVTGEDLFYGEAGLLRVPERGPSAVDAFGNAVSALVAAAAAAPGDRGHPCDVRLGREVVAILTAAETAIGAGAAVPL
jgi:hypothetical protein